MPIGTNNCEALPLHLLGTVASGLNFADSIKCFILAKRGGDGVMTVTLTFSPLRAIDNFYLISYLWSMLTIESVDV